MGTHVNEDVFHSVYVNLKTAGFCKGAVEEDKQGLVDDIWPIVLRVPPSSPD